LDVTNTPNKNIVVAQITLSGTKRIRIILGYGPQESDSLEIRE